MRSTFPKVLLILALSIGVEAAPRPTAVPVSFVASIDEWKGATYQVRLASDGTLEYSDIPSHGNPVRIKVSADRWKAFRRHLDAAKIWSWRPEYIDMAIADGKGWSLQIAYPDRSIRSSGSNAYPPKKQFDAFLAAVRELTGGKPFE
jgi:hypothetical protein